MFEIVSPAARLSGKLLLRGMDDLRKHVLNLLEAKGAHADFETVIRDFPVNARGRKLPGAAHTPWQLLEHLRIAQWDILEFSRDARHVSPVWPEGYWPQTEAPSTPSAWDESAAAFRRDLAAMRELIADERRDLMERLPHGEGQTLLREALILADHNSWHLGQLMLLRRAFEEGS